MKTRTKLAFVPVLLLAAGCAYNPPARHTAVYRDDLTPLTGYNPPAEQVQVYDARTGTTLSAAAAAQLDQDLVTSVRHEFDRYGALSGMLPNIDVTANSGTVTLSGSVPGEREKQMIDAMVRNTPGVVSLNNYLRIADPRVDSLAPTGRVADSSRLYSSSSGEVFNLHVQTQSELDRAMAQRILEELRADTVTGSAAPNVNIYVANGQATLRGTVRSERQRQSIATAVQRAIGPANLRNELWVQR
jgi:osmotically-inducible protein OsmY